jgi:hypothetical protein
MRNRIMLLVVAIAAAAVVAGAQPALAARQSAAGPCREAINGLISLLDAGKDDTPLYRDTFLTVVKTCGRHLPDPPPVADPLPGRDACHTLAAAMVDLIEDNKIDTLQFIKARTTFERVCLPR